MLIYDPDEELTELIESSSLTLSGDKVVGTYTSRTGDRFLLAYRNSKKYKLSLYLGNYQYHMAKIRELFPQFIVGDLLVLPRPTRDIYLSIHKHTIDSDELDTFNTIVADILKVLINNIPTTSYKHKGVK